MQTQNLNVHLEKIEQGHCLQHHPCNQCSAFRKRNVISSMKYDKTSVSVVIIYMHQNNTGFYSKNLRVISTHRRSYGGVVHGNQTGILSEGRAHRPSLQDTKLNVWVKLVLSLAGCFDKATD